MVALLMPSEPEVASMMRALLMSLESASPASYHAMLLLLRLESVVASVMRSMLPLRLECASSA
jgi:hypothetical protein